MLSIKALPGAPFLADRLPSDGSVAVGMIMPRVNAATSDVTVRLEIRNAHGDAVAGGDGVEAGGRRVGGRVVLAALGLVVQREPDAAVAVGAAGDAGAEDLEQDGADVAAHIGAQEEVDQVAGAGDWSNGPDLGLDDAGDEGVEAAEGGPGDAEDGVGAAEGHLADARRFKGSDVTLPYVEVDQIGSAGDVGERLAAQEQQEQHQTCQTFTRARTALTHHGFALSSR